MSRLRDLRRAARTLQALADDEDRELAATLIERLDRPRLRVVVAGEAKRGKSTLINRLVGRAVLPTGVTPVTALPTTVRVAEPPERVTVTYLDGRLEDRDLEGLDELVSERLNPHNTKGVKDVIVRLATAGLPGEDVDLVDTPGTGSVFEQNTAAARQSYESLDCVVVVLSASPPIDTAERALLQELSDRAVTTFVVLNKTDQLSAPEVQETIAFTRQVCSEAGVHATIWPISARDADQGFETFRSELGRYLDTHAERDALVALTGHALRLARRMRDETLIRKRIEELNRDGDQTVIATFRRQVDSLSRSAKATDDNCRVVGQRLIRDLGESGDRERRRLSAECQEALAAWEADHRGTLSVADVANSARPLVIEEITRAVRAWHAASATSVVAELEELAARCREEQANAAAALRNAGQAILDLEVSGDYEPVTLRSDHPLWLDFSPPASWDAPFATTMRRHLPGAPQRALTDLRTETGRLVERQMGRARSDIRMGLQESVRQLSLDLQRGQHRTLDKLSRLLDESLDRRRMDDEHSRDFAATLAARTDALELVIAGLGGHLDLQPPAGEDRRGDGSRRVGPAG